MARPESSELTRTQTVFNAQATAYTGGGHSGWQVQRASLSGFEQILHG